MTHFCSFFVKRQNAGTGHGVIMGRNAVPLLANYLAALDITGFGRAGFLKVVATVYGLWQNIFARH